jgi:hypothetical protein
MEEHIGFTIIREDFNEYEIENGLHLRLKPVVSDMVRKVDKNSFVLISDLISKIIMLFKKDPSNELRYDVTKELQFRPLKETISIYETEKTIVLVVYQLERVFPTNEKNNEGTPNLRMVKVLCC